MITIRKKARELFTLVRVLIASNSASYALTNDSTYCSISSPVRFCGLNAFSIKILYNDRLITIYERKKTVNTNEFCG